MLTKEVCSSKQITKIMTNAVLLVCDDCRNQEDKDDNFCTSCGYKLVNFHSSLEKKSKLFVL